MKAGVLVEIHCLGGLQQQNLLEHTGGLRLHCVEAEDEP